MHPPRKRERPDLAGSGTLENQHKPASNKPAAANAQAALVADPTFRRRVQRLYPLGDRVLALVLAQIVARHDCRADVERLIDGALEHQAAIRLFGIDRWRGAP